MDEQSSSVTLCTKISTKTPIRACLSCWPRRVSTPGREYAPSIPMGNRQGCSAQCRDSTPEDTRDVQPTIDGGVAPVQVPIAPYASLESGQRTSLYGYLTVDDPLTYREATEHKTQAAIFRLTLLATAISAGAGLVLGRGLIVVALRAP